MERNALKFLLDADNPDDVETAHAVVRLARGLRRKLEWWQKREALVTAGQR